MTAKLVASTILAGLAIVFVIQNVTVVKMRFLFWTLSMSMTVAMVLVLSLGLLSGWLLRGAFSRRKSRTHNQKLAVSE